MTDPNSLGRRMQKVLNERGVSDSPAARPIDFSRPAALDERRCIWPTREQINALSWLLNDLDQIGYHQPHNTRPVGELLTAWDAAPADATEAVARQQFAALQAQYPMTVIHDIEGTMNACRVKARAVLAALKQPQEN